MVCWLLREMPRNSILEKLRERIAGLEETQRRFSRAIPIADAVDRWMPHGGLPAGCIHEIKGVTLASALAFSAILSSRLVQNHGSGDRGNIVCIAPHQSFYPLGFLPYGIRPEQLLCISVRRSQHLAWALLEAVRCPQVNAVIATPGDLDLNASRRLQLAAEASGTTGFLLGSAASPPIAAPVTRWKVSPKTGEAAQRFDEPAWILDLLYCRGGRPGSWSVEWRKQQLRVLAGASVAPQIREERTG